MTSWHAEGILAEDHFHKHKGRRRAGRDHLIEILQCCSDNQGHDEGTDGEGGVTEEGAAKAQAPIMPSGSAQVMFSDVASAAGLVAVHK